MKSVMPMFAVDALLAAMTNTPDLFDGSVPVTLFTNDVTPTVNSQLSDFTPAAWTGIVTQSATGFPTGIFPDGRHGFLVQLAGPFTCTSEPTDPTTAYGYFVQAVAGALGLVMAHRFDRPVPVHAGMVLPVDVYVIVPLEVLQADPTPST